MVPSELEIEMLRLLAEYTPAKREDQLRQLRLAVKAAFEIFGPSDHRAIHLSEILVLAEDFVSDLT